MENSTCKKCGMLADMPMAYKCDVCGAESENHDSNHTCGVGHCIVKCSGCKKSETQCSC